MTKQFKGIALEKIAGVITFPENEIAMVLREEDAENIPLTKEEAKQLLEVFEHYCRELAAND